MTNYDVTSSKFCFASCCLELNFCIEFVDLAAEQGCDMVITYTMQTSIYLFIIYLFNIFNHKISRCKRILNADQHTLATIDRRISRFLCSF